MGAVAMASASVCAVCGEALPADAGNRRRYCGQGCKRAAEYELRRLNGLVYQAEKNVANFGAKLAGAPTFQAGSLTARLAYWQGRVTEGRARLRELLDDGEGDGAYSDPDRARR